MCSEPGCTYQARATIGVRAFPGQVESNLPHEIREMSHSDRSAAIRKFRRMQDKDPRLRVVGRERVIRCPHHGDTMRILRRPSKKRRKGYPRRA